MSFDLLLSSLYSETNQLLTLIKLIKEGKFSSHKAKHSKTVQGKLNKLWERYKELLACILLRKCGHTDRVICSRAFNELYMGCFMRKHACAYAETTKLQIRFTQNSLLVHPLSLLPKSGHLCQTILC